MNQRREASNLPQDVIHRAHQEERRGVSPEVLADIGEFVPGISKLRPEDYARVMGKAPDTDTTDHLEDPELDATWQQSRATPEGGSEMPANNGGRLTSAQQNANASAAERDHKERARHWRQDNRSW